MYKNLNVYQQIKNLYYLNINKKFFKLHKKIFSINYYSSKLHSKKRNII